jgi:hypothetical protein
MPPRNDLALFRSDPVADFVILTCFKRFKVQVLPLALILPAVLITALLGSFKSYSADISAPKNRSISRSVINEIDQFRNEVIQFTRKAAEAYLADKLQQATGKFSTRLLR